MHTHYWRNRNTVEKPVSLAFHQVRFKGTSRKEHQRWKRFDIGGIWNVAFYSTHSSPCLSKPGMCITHNAAAVDRLCVCQSPAVPASPSLRSNSVLVPNMSPQITLTWPWASPEGLFKALIFKWAVSPVRLYHQICGHNNQNHSTAPYVWIWMFESLSSFITTSPC